MGEELKNVVMIWRNLGPYHIARACAAAGALQGKNSELTVIELCGSEITRDWMQDGCKDLPFRIETIRPNETLGDATPSMVSEVQSLLDQIMPSAVAVAGYDRPEMRWALGWCRKNGAAPVVMSETKWDDSPRPFWKILILKRILRNCSALVSGTLSRKFMLRLGLTGDRIFTGYGAVDNDFYAGVSERIAASKSKNESSHFITCCRLIEDRKNLRVLFDAYNDYRRRDVNPWGLVICGDGPDRIMLEEYVGSREIHGVEFAGFKQIHELAEYYARAGCLVHPAVREAWGLAVNEAMASSLPVLVSGQSGCSVDLVKNGQNGFIFDALDRKKLADLMLGIASKSPEELKAMGSISRDIISRWSPKEFAAGLLAAINSSVFGIIK